MSSDPNTAERRASLITKMANDAEADLRASFATMHGNDIEPDRWMIDMARYFGSQAAWLLSGGGCEER